MSHRPLPQPASRHPYAPSSNPVTPYRPDLPQPSPLIA